MDTEKLYLDAIEIGDRLRRANPETVAALAASISSLGLRTPITVRSIPIPQPDGTNEYRFILVAGLHRLEAARSLNWIDIDCYVMEGASERDARLWEISENLHRADLSVQERSDQVAEWVRLTEESLKSAQLAPKLSTPAGRGKSADVLFQVGTKPLLVGRPEGGINAAARELNITKNEAHRAVKIANIVPEAKKAAAEAGVKSQKDLLEVAKAPVDQQVTKVTEIAQRRSKPVSPAPEPRNDIEVEEVQLTALMNAWNKASRTVRERFLETVQSPVFDTDPRQPTPLAH